MSELLAAWTVLAHQDRQSVGPWAQFLGVPQCAGHSAPA